jgi:peptide deformylase
MIKPIVRDILFLSQKADPATKEDISIGRDLQDTLQANADRCVGMAANMIGEKKRIIIVSLGFMNLVMYNPVIVKKDTPYETEEGCLSLEGVRKTTRYQNIEVEYMDSNWKKQKMKLTGWTAQRLKLASEMGRTQEDSVFVFDEPTIGLHPLDVKTLMGVFRSLIGTAVVLCTRLQLM